MEQIKSRHKRNVLIRVGILVFLPVPIMILAIFFGKLSKDVSLFRPDRQGYEADYILERLYPDLEESSVTVTVEYEGKTRISQDGQLLWEGSVSTDGIHKTDDNKVENYSVFWLPMYNEGVPRSRAHWMRDISEARIIDLGGLIEKKVRSYGVAVRNEDGEWHKAYWSQSGGAQAPKVKHVRGLSPLIADSKLPGKRDNYQDVFLLGQGGAVVARARYEISTGLLAELISLPQNGASLVLTGDNLPKTSFISLLLPVVLVVTGLLAGYEIFVSSVKEEKKSKRPGIPLQIDFAFFGYTAALVDIYLDYAFYPHVPASLLLAAHLIAVPLFWFRFGIWSVMPLAELAFAIFNHIVFRQMSATFMYFPSLLATWLMIILTQGSVSPGVFPKIKFLKRLAE